MKATRLEQLEGFNGEAWLYRLDPPFRLESWRMSTFQFETAEYVVSSAVIAYSGPETLVFASTSKGDPLDMAEIGGGRGYLDCDTAIKMMGYEVVS